MLVAAALLSTVEESRARGADSEACRVMILGEREVGSCLVINVRAPPPERGRDVPRMRRDPLTPTISLNRRGGRCAALGTTGRELWRVGCGVRTSGSLAPWAMTTWHYYVVPCAGERECEERQNVNEREFSESEREFLMEHAL